MKRVVSAGVNAEGSVEASWLRAQEEEVFGARSGADGQKAADRGGTVSRCGVNTGHRPRTSSSTARNLRSARLFHGTAFRQCVGRSKQAYKILRFLSDLFFIVSYYSAMAKIWPPARVAKAYWMVVAIHLQV